MESAGAKQVALCQNTRCQGSTICHRQLGNNPYGSIIMVVTSDSMLPTLNPYDLIVVEKTSIERIAVGDIIAFDTHMEGLGIVAHRVVEISNDQGEIEIHTQGDNVESPDLWIVRTEDLIGKVIDVVPKMGIFLIEPVRYAIVAVIIVTAISLLREVTAKPSTPDQH
ncbi:MAG: signal peptidase I [Nitrososphaerales archaeon]